ncbi:nicotinate-nicotinamide nucleotide adenylyltransferase [Vibrio gallicus]|uniref:nicotinate-nicotinamide nucleotide adenylyltransferase n=1 Tax=Vibrio gallicus TaxID=190897 RepID=UPI0021C3D9C1|nr:nicotinate-nicotinamide nucleotide adenylyltransferase [Vibrio gallicus]
MANIAVFGSAFNPPHYGHLSVVERLSHFDKVLLVPSIAHAWGKEMLDYAVRCELVEAFIGDIRCRNVALSRVEQALYNGIDRVTTFQVLEALQLDSPTDEFTFVMGPDNLFSFSKFDKSDEILRRWSVLACPQTHDIRSTDIRKKVEHSQEINNLTSTNVVSMLQKKGLYLKL